MVHPDFRGKGIFLETLRKLNGRLSEQKVDLIYAFPNDYSIGVFINKLDYCHLTDIFTMTLPLGSLKKNKNPDLRFDFQKNINFEQTDIDFISSRLQQYKIFNLRDADYLNWRYHKDSGKKYCVLRVFDQNKQVGLTVCKIYQKDMSIDLVEFFFNDDENLISSALRAIRDYHKSADIKLFSIWSMEHYSCYKYLFKMGFRRSGQATHFIYRIFSDSCSADCGKISSYYLSMGDSDVY
jgi:hypothetical protein